MKKQISVAMATYNGSKYIEQQLDSILRQNIEVVEIIIVDDKSSDSTLEIINKYQNQHQYIKLFVNTVNIGPSLTFKRAISECKGDYIALSDQDDIWEKDKLETSMKYMLKMKDQRSPCVVFTDLKVIDDSETIIQKSYWEYRRIDPFKVNFKNILFYNVITGCTTLINRSMAFELSKMPAEGVLLHDHWIALVAYGLGEAIPVKIQPIKYRTHQNSATIKEHPTLLDRFHQIWNLLFLNRNPEYLLANIKQGAKFYELYSSKLKQTDIRALTNFSKLGEKSVFLRSIYSTLNKI
jgi:glycosyltransferase involved in cell wall biosynthesis